MINLNYYYRTDSYELNNIIKKGLSFDYYNTLREYGFSLYLTDKPKINLNNKNIVLKVHFKNLDNILRVVNFHELLTEHLNVTDATSSANVNIMSCPNIIGGTPIESGMIVGLNSQTNTIENGKYLCYGVGKPLQRFIDVNSYINSFGITPRLGTKAVEPYMKANGYSGLHVTSENLMVLYNTSNIRYIKVYDENAKYEHVQ
jgi:hypothetical protein